MACKVCIRLIIYLKFHKYFQKNIYIVILYQLLSENQHYSLNSTYNFCAFKNLQFRFQEKNL